MECADGRELDAEGRNLLTEKLAESGIFEIRETGHIEVRKSKIKENHPRCHGYLLPVGYIREQNGKVSALLVNTNLKSLEKYYKILKEIYCSVMRPF